MTLVHWSPFRPAATWEREMQSFFDRVFEGRSFAEPRSWRPRVDIYRDNEDLVVRAEVPGVDPEKDLDVTFDKKALVITGRRTEDTEISDDARFVRERYFGEFKREIVLPEGLDPERFTADYDAGVLTVRLPLPAQLDERPRSIPVTVGTPQPTDEA